jgi:hypothetical protein
MDYFDKNKPSPDMLNQIASDPQYTEYQSWATGWLDKYTPGWTPTTAAAAIAPGATITEPPRFTPSEVSSTIDKLKTATVDDIIAGDIPLAYYGGSELGPEIVAQYNNGKIRLFDSFFKLSPQDRPSLLYHEFGHEVTRIAFAKYSEEINTVLNKFKLGTMKYDNFAGASSRPDEMIADIYAQAISAKQPLWEIGGKYERATTDVLNIAYEAGLPVPKWFSPSKRTLKK